MEAMLQGLRAAGEETRLRLLVLCAHSELTVSELLQILGQSQPRVSRHLKLLCEAGLLDRFQEGSWVYYRLANRGANALLARYLVDLTPEEDVTIARDLDRLDAVRQARNDAAMAYFKKNASQWNEIRSLHIEEKQVEQRLLKILDKCEEKREGKFRDFLDIGTGTGRMLELFGPRVSNAVGIDNSREMLSYARAMIEDKGLRDSQVRLGDMYTLPVASQSQDLVTVHQVMHYADRPKIVLEEARRVLREDGILIVVDFAPHDLVNLKENHAHQQMGFDQSQMEDWCRENNFETLETYSLPGQPLTVNIWVAVAKQNELGVK